jgi:signal transduction histidine kinase
MRLGLRAKLALGFAVLFAVLAGFGVAALSWISRLGESAAVILRENYRSVVAAQEMKEAVERMDSGALFALAGEDAEGRRLADEHGPRFAAALAVEQGNLTLPGEGELAARLGDAYAAYRADLARVLDPAAPLAERRDLYFARLLPRFQEVKRLADEILALNQRNMVEASGRARALAARARQRLLLTLLAGAAVAAAAVSFLSRAILGPLGRLTASTREIAAGHLDLAVGAPSGDELGRLADAFNAMARRLAELRKSDEARLVRARETSRLAVDSLPDAVVLLAPDGTVELANRAAGALLGIAPGRPLPERHAGWLAPLLAGAREGAAAPGPGGGDPGEGEGADVLQLFADGRERFFRPRALPIRDGEGALAGTTLILADVTEARRRDELAADLVATVSHELKTPLTSVEMAVHLLLEERLGPLTREQTDLLVGAREDAGRLREIVAGLLEVARLESGRDRLDLHPVAPAELVAASAEPLAAAFADRGVALALAVDPAAPAVLADPARARLVLDNLLRNALEHTPPGGRVAVGAAAAADRVRFTVADDGPGIPSEHLAHVFERFARVPGSAPGGAGLGLSIAREVVLAHGGEIRAESRPGEGATFTFDLPIAGDPEGSEHPATVPSSQEVTEP